MRATTKGATRFIIEMISAYFANWLPILHRYFAKPMSGWLAVVVLSWSMVASMERVSRLLIEAMISAGKMYSGIM